MLQILTSPKFIKWASLALAIGLTARFCYTAGVNSERAEHQEKTIKLVESQKKALEAAIEATRRQQQAESKRALEALQEAHEIETRARAIEHEINTTTFDCNDLGGEFLRLFNSAIPD